MPPDVIYITDEFYFGLMDGQSHGKTITPNGTEPPYLVDPIVDDVASAEHYRQKLIKQIDDTTADLRVELMLGDISDEDKVKLSEWIAYKKVVKNFDVSTAPNIEWPIPPDPLPE
ncbi:TPA: tail fiber assembly protein [Citrobacter koseri]|nr:tail fiber assembly protein [Citrobacter koseri]